MLSNKGDLGKDEPQRPRAQVGWRRMVAVLRDEAGDRKSQLSGANQKRTVGASGVQRIFLEVCKAAINKVELTKHRSCPTNFR